MPAWWQAVRWMPIRAQPPNLIFRNMESSKSREKCPKSINRATAKRNLQISSVAIGSTFAFLVGVALVSEFTSGNDVALVPYLHMLNWSHYAGVIDGCINSICPMLMFKRLWATEGKVAASSRSRGRVVKTTDLMSSSGVIQTCESLFPDDSEVASLTISSAFQQSDKSQI